MSKCRRCGTEVDKYTTMFGYCEKCIKLMDVLMDGLTDEPCLKCKNFSFCYEIPDDGGNDNTHLIVECQEKDYKYFQQSTKELNKWFILECILALLLVVLFLGTVVFLVAK